LQEEFLKLLREIGVVKDEKVTHGTC
jgi:hypothetical protein